MGEQRLLLEGSATSFAGKADPTKLDVDASGDRFTKNLARIHLRGRCCGAVLRSTAFAEVALTA